MTEINTKEIVEGKIEDKVRQIRIKQLPHEQTNTVGSFHRIFKTLNLRSEGFTQMIMEDRQWSLPIILFVHRHTQVTRIDLNI